MTSRSGGNAYEGNMQAGPVTVRLAGAEESSGLAMMLSQYLEQNLRDFPEKSEQAVRIRGRLALEATEGDVGVTLDFRGGKIEIADGCAPDATIFVHGGIFSITELATGGKGALREILQGRLKVRSAWKHPIFVFRIAAFMKLPDEMRRTGTAGSRALWPRLLIGAGGAAVLLGLMAYFLWR
jgi:hypothetical protein